MMRLVVSAAGNCATDLFLNWTDSGGDEELSRQWLRELGADAVQTDALMQTARATAHALVPILDDEIHAVADALRTHRVLSQDQIDAAMHPETHAP
jgi:hypothetical protein